LRGGACAGTGKEKERTGIIHYRGQEKDRHHSLLLIIAVIGGGARLDARAKSPVFRAVHGPFPPSGGIRPVLEHG
jgi:hypothetical protein